MRLRPPETFSDGLKQMRVGATLSPFQVELLPVGGPGDRGDSR